jgi:hypothetical protein
MGKGRFLTVEYVLLIPSVLLYAGSVKLFGPNAHSGDLAAAVQELIGSGIQR